MNRICFCDGWDEEVKEADKLVPIFGKASLGFRRTEA
jgi:hypothetical protein